MRSYFTNRKNRVKINEQTASDWCTTKRGCPQGSAFGPDDHQLFSVTKPAKEVEHTLNEGGNNISDCYNNNLLQGNFSKYQTMSLGPRNCPKDL